MTCFVVAAGSRKLRHLKVERLGEFRRYPVLVEHHLHSLAESGQGLLARVAVGVRPTRRPKPCVRAPGPIFVLFDGDRDMHCPHCCLPCSGSTLPLSGRSRLTAAIRLAILVAATGTKQEPSSAPFR